MTNATATTATATTPLAAAAELLGRMLTSRFLAAEGRAPEGTAPPRVVPLGDVDVLRPAADPLAGLRGAATVHLTSRAVLVGPWGGGCGHCLAIRWQRLRERYERDALETGEGLRSAGGGPAVTGYLADAVSAAHDAGQDSVPRTGTPTVTSVDTTTLALRTVPLLPEPRCPSCAPADTDTAEGATLRLTVRRRPETGGYRLRAPHEYGLETAALANPVCGVLGTGTNMDLVCPTSAPVSAGATTRVAADGLVDISFSGHTTSYTTSREVALLEGLERYAGTDRRRNAPFVVDSYANLAGQALDPRDRGVYRPEVYEADDRLTPFDPDRPIPWVWGYSLRDERPLLVPARSVHYGGGTVAENFVYESSNGCAGGSCLEEAVLFGLLELIERDAFMLGWYGGAELTEIDMSDHPDRATRALWERAALYGYDVRLIDNRIDLDVPVVTAVAIRRDGGPGLLSFAAGAGLDPVDAVRAAVSEVVTFVPTLARRVHERWSELDAMAEDFAKVRVLADHAVLFGLPRMAEHAARYTRPARRTTFAEAFDGWSARRPSSGDLLADLAHCRDQIVAAGHDVVVVDVTSPEQRAYGVHSVATIAPGLLPIDFGWDKQRALGLPRLPAVFGRREMHRVPHPFP
ncbi:TOMM precursor leader peptide-binding protein [Streptomyces sp. NPDC101150]|uniref:TOMM precursor leader peptide-binding protein n=1 Tax=Streptomyces sp. NPDC101150 TaxID=3366114 RepID=UPI0037FF411D